MLNVLNVTGYKDMDWIHLA